MEATLAEDLGADSLDAVELNIALEEQLGLSIAALTFHFGTEIKILPIVGIALEVELNI